MKTMNRTGTLKRTTKETDIELSLKLDGTGIADIDTGIRFFDHMLSGFARHGLFDLTCIAKGDLEVDCHHTIEDTGIVLGQAIREAAGDKKGMVRFGSCILPMDEALVLCSLDLSGRPCFVSNAVFPTERVGEMDINLEYSYAFTTRKKDVAYMILRVNDNEKAVEVLTENGIKLVDQDEISKL